VAKSSRSETIARNKASKARLEAAMEANRAFTRDTIIPAIEAKRAYLDTFRGRARVTSFNPDTGDCWTDQGWFMVCKEAIKFDAA
jgi:hypothetical protein